jgi:hypothetical protein
MTRTIRAAAASTIAAIVLPGTLLASVPAAQADDPAPETLPTLTKAHIEYLERVQLAARTKAEVEHDERLLQWLIDRHAR